MFSVVNNYLGHLKPSKTLFLVPKIQVFGGENLCFSWLSGCPWYRVYSLVLEADEVVGE